MGKSWIFISDNSQKNGHLRHHSPILNSGNVQFAHKYEHMNDKSSEY